MGEQALDMDTHQRFATDTWALEHRLAAIS